MNRTQRTVLVAAAMTGIAAPTFVIGRTKLVGEQTLDELDAAIQPMLAAR